MFVEKVTNNRPHNVIISIVLKHLLWEVHGGLLGFTHPDQVDWGFALAVVTVLHS